MTRYNAEGRGLEDRPKSGRPPPLTDGEQAAPTALILRGLDPERDGISSYTREDIPELMLQRFQKRHPVEPKQAAAPHRFLAPQGPG